MLGKMMPTYCKRLPSRESSRSEEVKYIAPSMAAVMPSLGHGRPPDCALHTSSSATLALPTIENAL